MHVTKSSPEPIEYIPQAPQVMCRYSDAQLLLQRVSTCVRDLSSKSQYEILAELKAIFSGVANTKSDFSGPQLIQLHAFKSRVIQFCRNTGLQYFENLAKDFEAIKIL